MGNCQIIFSALTLSILSLSSQGQQDGLYSQYMFNLFGINAGYAGSRNAISAVALHRRQWLNIDGAPRTSSVSIHGNFGDKYRMGAGINVVNDVIGPATNLGVLGAFAYHLPFSVGKLSLALRGGMYSSKLDRSQLKYANPADRFNSQQVVRSIVPTFDFGAYYYTSYWYVGLAINHLSQQKLGFSEGGYVTEHQLNRYIILMGGWAKQIKENLVLKPSLNVKYIANAPVNAEVNCSALFHKSFWLGVSYRTDNSLILLGEYNHSSGLRFGYSYDYAFGHLNGLTAGSHEVFVGFDYNSKRKKSISPRLL